jgi:hypothetical protein
MARPHGNRSLSQKDKGRVLDDLKAGKTVDDLVLKWKVSRSTIYNIKSDEESIRLRAVKDGKKKRFRTSPFVSIESALFERVTELRTLQPSVPISGNWLKREAQALAAEEDSHSCAVRHECRPRTYQQPFFLLVLLTRRC